MRKRDIIGIVLFWLGLLTCFGGAAVLEYLGFGRSVVWIEEFDRVTAAVVLGLVMMAASLAMDLISYIKKRGDRDE